MKQFRLYAIAVLILIAGSRLPYIFDGYGSEEDAWALPLVAERTGTTGIYEVSRLPGHPLQELVYACIYNAGPVIFNLLTVIISTTGIGFLMFALKRTGIRYPVIIGLLVAFTPVVYINSTNDMDYTWALSFILISFWGICRQKPITAGVFLAMAIACRITSGAMIIPFAYLLYRYTDDRKTKHLYIFIASCAIATLVLFLPVFKEYGLSFFTFYEHFPIPGFVKNLYKGTVGVWGIPLMIAFAVIKFQLLLRNRKSSLQPLFKFEDSRHRYLVHASFIVIALYVLAFIRMPLKSAFMIPLIPFVSILAGIFCNKKQLYFLLAASVISCFFFGINLDDSRRGSEVSAYSYRTTVSGQPVAVDLLQGLVPADQSKRRQRTAFSKQVLEEAQNISENSVLIAGWWLSDMLVLSRDNPPLHVTFRYYTQEDTLKMIASQGTAIYYLPQQDEINDLRFRGNFTALYAKPFPLSR